jgi:hypothetical protein
MLAHPYNMGHGTQGLMGVGVLGVNEPVCHMTCDVSMCMRWVLPLLLCPRVTCDSVTGLTP